MSEEAKTMIKKYHSKHVSPAGITSLLQQAGLTGEMGNYQAVKKYVEREINILNQAALRAAMEANR